MNKKWKIKVENVDLNHWKGQKIIYISKVQKDPYTSENVKNHFILIKSMTIGPLEILYGECEYNTNLKILHLEIGKWIEFGTHYTSENSLSYSNSIQDITSAESK